MGKRKSTKPQKYVKQSDDEDDDHLYLYDMEIEEENSRNRVTPTTSEMNIHALWDKGGAENSTKSVMSKEKLQMADQSTENNVWQNHFQQNAIDSLTDNKYLEPCHFKIEKVTSLHSALSIRTKNLLNHGHLESLLSEKVYASNAFPEERLSDSRQSMSVMNVSGTESDRRSTHEFESEYREMKPKRRRKYVTYPATFRLEVVEYAERNGKSAAAKKYNICVEKVSMWCKTKDNIIHKVKKSGFPLADGAVENNFEIKNEEMQLIPLQEPELSTQCNETQIKKEVDEEKRYQIAKELEILYNDDSEGSDKYDADSLRKQEVVFSPYFKLRVIKAAEEKGENSAAREYLVCERRVNLWCKAKDIITEKAKKQKTEEWECDLYVKLKSLLDMRQDVTVRDFIEKAEQAQLSNPSPAYVAITITWLISWCRKFNVRFNSVLDSIPQPLTEDASLILETTWSPSDRDEVQAVFTSGKKKKVQEIQVIKKTDASASASDKEDSFSFSASNKRRRRSYTLAFKLEVVKFAQSHTKHATSRKYGIARRVISRWIADKEVLQNDLINATQQVLDGSAISEDLDSELLQWYKDLKRRGNTVSKDMICARARNLFISIGQINFCASNGWYRRWLHKWKERGEQLDIIEEEDDNDGCLPVTFPSTMVPTNHQESEKIQKCKTEPEVEPINIASETDIVNAKHNSGITASEHQPESADLKVPSTLPENMNAIQHSPSSTSSDHNVVTTSDHQSGDCKTENIFKACSSSLQAAVNYCKEIDKSTIRPSDSSIMHSNQPRNVYNVKKNTPHARKRRERYLPEFKLTVIGYASNHSYQETSRKFGVHHITVSEWCKDKEKIKKLVYADNLQSKILKSETAEQKFLTWIQDCNKQKLVIKPSDVQKKANEILNIIGEAEVKKNCWWFYLWNKRGMESEKLLDDETDIELLEKDSRVNYPPAVKIEIAKVAERQSVNSAARCFRVARKRIREWVKTKGKLKWLAETGQVRERSLGKKVNCLDADKELYKWFKTSKAVDIKPKFSEIRSKALEIFQKHGFNNMKCSSGWYKSWCNRYGISTSSENDDKLIKWVLTRYDENLPVTYQQLLDFVSSEINQDECSNATMKDWGINFCKRFPKLLQTLPTVDEVFPEQMEIDIKKFRQEIREVQEKNGFSLASIGCMDEIPISFTQCSDEKKVIVNCGLDSCDAVVILSCLADGGILPPLIILKEQSQAMSEIRDSSYVMYAERTFVDESTVKQWLEKIWLHYVPSPSLLVLDCFKSHIASLLQENMSESGVTPVIIPEGCSPKLQPLTPYIVKTFQSLIQEIWNHHSIEIEYTPSNDSKLKAVDTYLPSPEEIIQWILNAHNKLQSQQDLIRRSFIVTGISVASDHSEDGLIENTEWFGQPSSERILSPVNNEEDSESDI